MDHWILNQLRAQVIVDLQGHIPDDYFTSKSEELKIHERIPSSKFLSQEITWGYLAARIGKKLHFEPDSQLTARQVSASEVLMNLGMLVGAQAARDTARNLAASIEDIDRVSNKPMLDNVRDFDCKLAPQLATLESNVRSALEQYLLYLSADEARPFVSLIEVNQVTVTSSPTKEIFLLKPALWGIGIDLRALWDKVRSRKML